MHVSHRESKSERGGETVRLLKAIYGLKQAGRIWYQTLSDELIARGMKRLNTDECIFMVRRGSSLLIMLIYVDDITIICNNPALRDEYKGFLNARFLMKDLGATKKLLGIEFDGATADGCVVLHQSEYIRTILRRFGMDGAKIQHTPMIAGQKLMEAKPGEERADVGLYQSMLGSAMYAMVATRPDLAYALSTLARLCLSFKDAHDSNATTLRISPQDQRLWFGVQV